MQELEKHHKKFYSLVLLIIVIQIIAWLILKPVWAFSDDYCYAINASNLFSNSFHFTNDEFQNRIGVYFPVAIIFYFFKISPQSIALFSLLISISTTIVLFYFLKKINKITIGIFASFLVAINILQLTYSIVLFPDIIISFYSITLVLLFYYARKSNSNQWKHSLLIGFILFIAVLTKETIALIFPFLFLLLIYDTFQKQHYLFWKKTIVSCLVFLILFFVFYFFATGDVFFRIKNLVAYNANNLYDKAMADSINLKYSSTIFKWINEQLAYVFILIFSLPMFYKLLKKQTTDFTTYISVFSLSLLLIYCTCFFIPKYSVLFKMERIWMILIPPLSLLSAFTIAEANKKIFLFFIIIFFILGIYNYETIGIRRAILFFSFSIINILLFIDAIKFRFKNLLLLIPFVLLSINFIYANSNYKAFTILSSDIVKNELEKLNNENETKIIITDKEFAENHIIYNQFKEYNNLKFIAFEKLDSIEKINSKYYLLFHLEHFNKVKHYIENKKYDTIVFNSKGLLILKKK